MSRRSAGILTDQRGAALFATVLGMLLLSTLMVAYAVVARDETLIAQTGREEVQAAFAAEAGSNHGRWILAQRVRQDLPRVVALTARAALVTALQNTYNTPAGGAQFLVDMATPAGGGPIFAVCSATVQGCPEPSYSEVGTIADAQQVVLTLTPGAGSPLDYGTRVIVGVHPAIPPLIRAGGTSAEFTYVWRVESSGTAGRALQQFVIHDSSVPTNTAGSFTIALNSSFVQYAHFIENMTSDDAWMSFRHIYTGPVHTNNRFNILGNPTGPTFRSPATQWALDIRFRNSPGSAITEPQDSNPTRDEPWLGAAPGIPCQVDDCSGLTRGFDFDPTTVAIDKIPFPTAGTPDRTAQITLAQGPNYAANSVACATGPCPVIVAHSAAGLLNGGIYVNGRVVDLQLAATGNGQLLVFETPSVAVAGFGGSSRRRTVITESRAAGQITVERQCRGPATGGCGTPRDQWNADTTITPVTERTATYTGLLSPNPSTDRGVVFVNSACVNNSCGTGLGAIGERSTLTGLRKDPSTAVTRAIDQNTRLTIAADGDIYLTGNLTYQVDPRGGDAVFDSVNCNQADDDNLNVQNAFGVVSWDGGIHLSSDLNQTEINNTLPVGDPHRDGNLRFQGMFMTTNLSGGTSTGEGQISFDDPNGSFRGQASLLGGVVQVTMGTFGVPGTPGLGYARDWVYDERFRCRGLAPPAFPGFPNFTAATSLGIDSYTWRMGLF
jgi:hypothetical protein